jgi:hypothetical protein
MEEGALPDLGPFFDGNDEPLKNEDGSPIEAKAMVRAEQACSCMTRNHLMFSFLSLFILRTRFYI